MSTFLNRFSHDTDGKIVTNSSFGGTPVIHDGLAYDETIADTLVVVASGIAAFYHCGLAFNTVGALLILEASAGLPANTVWQNGLPLSDDQLCVDATNAVAYYHDGIGFTSVGAVAVSDGGGPVIPSFLLLETGDHILLETGDSLLLG